MRTCASVDLPDPLGPITAWTSPERTVRSMPRRISLPATPARRPASCRTWAPWAGGADTSVIGQHPHDLAIVDPHVVDGHRPGRRQRQRLAARQVELAAV